MAELPVEEAILTTREGGDDGYDVDRGRRLAQWVFGLLEHAAEGRKKLTREDQWDKDWTFIAKQKQWEGPLPTYRRPILVNIWRRAFHVVLATLMGNRPTLKLVPGGALPQEQFAIWQQALWSALKTQGVLEEYADAWSWAAVGEGGVLKVGYGSAGELTEELPDVIVRAIPPRKFFPDPECTDPTLAECSFICFRDALDLATIGRRYPEQAHRVTPDGDVSMAWVQDKVPSWVGQQTAISPTGGWTVSGQWRRARATAVECCVDDPAIELREHTIPVFDPTTKALLDTRTEKRWERVYPYGRLITCTRDVTLRDIPNPFGKAWGWARRWPYVFVEGAFQPHTLWRPGLLSDLTELQRAINKSLSVLLENAIKVTNAMVIADENAMDDEDWDLLSLVPGVKIRKRAGTEFRVQFPEALPEHAFRLPDYFIRKLEEVVGLHDPPIAPGQAVAAKTVAFLQQKGNFLLGIMAKLGDEALERVGHRIVGLMVSRYLPNRPIPLSDGQRLTGDFAPLPELPAALRFRVEASSGFQELLASLFQAAQAEALATRHRTDRDRR